MINKKKLFVLFVGLTFLMAFSVNVSASSAKTVGLGSEFVTITGPDAIYSNPAGVNAGDSNFALELSTSVNMWNNLLANDYYETDEQKDDVLAKIEDDGLFLGADLRAGPKLMVGPVALNVDARGDALINLNDDIAELLLKGNELGESYSFEGSSGSGAAYADAGLNLSLRAPQNLIEEWYLEDVYVGFTYHQLAGALFAVDGEGEIRFGDYDDEIEEVISGDGHLKYKFTNPEAIENLEPALGSAFDLGAYVQIDERYSAAFSVMNVGSMTSSDVKYQELEYDGEEFVSGDLKDYDGELAWTLPSSIRVGGEMDYNQYFDFMANYSYTNYNLASNVDKTDHNFALATEITPVRFIPLRTGFSYSSLSNNFKWSAGMGTYLGPLRFDIGFSDLSALWYDAKGGEVAATFKIEF